MFNFERFRYSSHLKRNGLKLNYYERLFPQKNFLSVFGKKVHLLYVFMSKMVAMLELVILRLRFLKFYNLIVHLRMTITIFIGLDVLRSPDVFFTGH